ncbi:unnamed protein product [Arabidopsis thaliana]|uniref:Transmembrane protein n=3 Tax=Arabidopsis TaxID=3701 RepID=A0A654EHP1_ARATH|nr:hypothetical protein ISN44_As01g042830 [Arabidopsis suecica]VYS48823.1 unnamed protein product [Arabidopsis thaliana]
MATERFSIMLISVLVLAVVLSPILPCQATRAHLDAETRMLRRVCPSCVCCAPAPRGACCPCRCPKNP